MPKVLLAAATCALLSIISPRLRLRRAGVRTMSEKESTRMELMGGRRA